MTYYNDNDPRACAWLRELIAAGELPAGDVDCRSILEVKADELAKYDQCHFFAGIGGWPLALRWAGLEGFAGIWTGSCPCQPLSCAGQRKGHADERHLWPAFHDLIAQCRPAVVFGEQVASADGREWFDGVRADLEDLGYACGGADLCAAGVRAPHRRQRLYWVADAGRQGLQGWGQRGSRSALGQTSRGREIGTLAHADGARPAEQRRGWKEPARPDEAGGAGVLADATGPRLAGAGEGTRDNGDRKNQNAYGIRRIGQLADGGGLGDAAGRGCGVGGDAPQPGHGGHADRAGWSRFDILPCRDGKARRVESGTFPLAHGIPGRMGLLRGYGNAIVPQVAEVFIRAWLDSLPIPSPRNTKRRIAHVQPDGDADQHGVTMNDYPDP